MPPNPMLVDPLVSYAHRAGGQVRLVLVLPQARFRRTQVEVRLVDKAARDTAGDVVVSAEAVAAGSGVRVECAIDQSAVPGVLVGLQLRVNPEGPFRPLRTRLVTREGQPVALLPPFAADVVGT